VRAFLFLAMSPYLPLSLAPVYPAVYLL
jgi:hypothetical protein